MDDKPNLLCSIDNWYAGKFERGYTNKDALEITSVLVRSVESTISAEIREQVMRLASAKFSRNAMIEEAKEYFSKTYPFLEQLASGKHPLFLEAQKHVPEGLWNEYMQPVIESFVRLNKFIEAVEQRAQSVEPAQLQEKDIDEAFVSVFVDGKGFAVWMNELIDVFSALCDVTEQPALFKMLQEMKVVLPSIYEKIFQIG